MCVVCMCVCSFMCIHVRVVCMHSSVGVWCVHVCMYICVVCAFMCMYVCMCVCVYAMMRVHVCVHMCAHIAAGASYCSESTDFSSAKKAGDVFTLGKTLWVPGPYESCVHVILFNPSQSFTQCMWLELLFADEKTVAHGGLSD